MKKIACLGLSVLLISATADEAAGLKCGSNKKHPNAMQKIGKVACKGTQATLRGGGHLANEIVKASAFGKGSPPIGNPIRLPPNPADGGDPTMNYLLGGSWVEFYATNQGATQFTCTASYTYEYEDYGTVKSQNEKDSFTVVPHAHGIVVYTHQETHHIKSITTGPSYTCRRS